MATTKNTDQVTTLPYSEDDKLGPLGNKVSALHEPSDLRAALVREFADAVQDAKDAAGKVDENAMKAVHAARKALRRCRAVLGLLAGALPKSERRAVGRALREARRSLSTARDHAVAPDTAAKLALSDDDRATAQRILDNAAGALPAVPELKQLVAESAARAAAQLEAIEAALPAELAWSLVLDGLRTTYAEARRARRAGKRSKAWFHAWRRRSKELSHQLELVAAHAGPRLAAVQGEVSSVTDRLAPAVDLIMLREFVATYGQGVPTDEVDHLKATIDAQLADLTKDARKGGRDTFSQKPRKFARRLDKAVRRDLTPMDDANGNGHDLA